MPMQPHREGRGILQPIHNLSTKRGWLISTSWTLYLGGKPSAHHTGGWVGFEAGLARQRTSCLHRVQSLDCPAHSESLSL